jgi:hypothetical protein
MNKRHIAIATILLVALATFFRYEIVTPGGNRPPYKLDRWTGDTAVLYGEQERPVVRVEPAKPNEFDKVFGNPNYQGPPPHPSRP